MSSKKKKKSDKNGNKNDALSGRMTADPSFGASSALPVSANLTENSKTVNVKPDGNSPAGCASNIHVTLPSAEEHGLNAAPGHSDTTADDSVRSSDGASNTDKGSAQIGDSSSNTDKGSRQSAHSASNTDKGSGQSADTASKTDKGSGQSADSVSNTDKGSGQSADTASNTDKGSVQSADSLSNTDNRSEQSADSASKESDGSGQSPDSASNRLPVVKDSDSFGGVLQGLWRNVKNQWRFYLIMSLTVGGTGLASGIVGTILTLTIWRDWFNGPQTTDMKVAPQNLIPQAEIDRIKQDFKKETELKLTNFRREINETKHNMSEFSSSLAGLTDNVSQCQQNYSVVIGRQNTTDSLNKTLEIIVKNVSDLSNETRQLGLAGQNTCMEVKRLHNTTTLLNETLHDKTRDMRDDFHTEITMLKKEYEAQLETVTKQLEQTYSSKLNEEMKKFSNSIAEISHTCEKRVEATRKENQLEVQTMQERVVQQLSHVDSRQDFMFTLIHQLGFMRLDTWGPVLLILAAIELILMLLMCRQGAKAGSAIINRGTRALANGQPQQSNRPNRADWLRESGDRGDNRLCVICFRKRDLPRVQEISEKLVQGMRNAQRLCLEPFLVDTREDIQRIPACRAALVFVDPDERLMILEDKRHHMGGDRRDTVQELIDTNVDVTLVIYDDNTDGDVGPDDLYNRRLSQVREHNLLKMLDQKKRVVSIKKGRPFTDKQRNHILKELDQTFK